MSDVSILEFLVYGLICYSGVLLVIASAFKDEKLGKSQSAVRVIWLIPSIFAAFMLASIGGFDIYLETISTNSTTYNVTGNVILTNSTSTTDKTLTLLNPVWVPLHILFFVILMIYVIWNIVMMFGKRT